jgi:Arc-like DNA binding dprotein
MARKTKKAAPHLRIRIEPELLARLEKSRKVHGRTLTGEIVHRIEQSFQKEQIADVTADALRAAAGNRTSDLLRALATAIWLIERRAGKKWDQDPETYGQVLMVLEPIISAFVRPYDAKRAWFVFKQELPPVGPEGHGVFGNILQLDQSAKAAALETLQQMGMAPSDAEIAEGAKKFEIAEAARRRARANRPSRPSGFYSLADLPQEAPKDKGEEK